MGLAAQGLGQNTKALRRPTGRLRYHAARSTARIIATARSIFRVLDFAAFVGTSPIGCGG